MNKYQKIINKIARAEVNEFNGYTYFTDMSFYRGRKSIRRLHKNGPYENMQSYYAFWHKKNKWGH